MKRKLKQILSGAVFLGLIGLASISTFPGEEHYSSIRKPFRQFQAHAGVDPVSPYAELTKNGSSLFYRADTSGRFISEDKGAILSFDSELHEYDNPDSMKVVYDELTGKKRWKKHQD